MEEPSRDDADCNVARPGITTEEHAQYMEERKGLVDAARESARTFDQAALAFGSAVFGASIVFLKDVASKPQSYTLKWLGTSWGCFATGLLAVMLSFLFSHRACMFEIHIGADALGKRDYERPKNRWSNLTDWANGLCVAFLFLGLISWSIFAFENLASGGSMPDNVKKPHSSENLWESYSPPRNPPPPPPAPTKFTPPPPPSDKGK